MRTSTLSAQLCMVRGICVQTGVGSEISETRQIGRLAAVMTIAATEQVDGKDGERGGGGVPDIETIVLNMDVETTFKAGL